MSRIYATEDDCKSVLGKKIQYWRAERPNEWIMDEFIDGAEKQAAEIERLQAQIDSLMLEYCPNEMTEAQKENWAKHQVRVEG